MLALALPCQGRQPQYYYIPPAYVSRVTYLRPLTVFFFFPPPSSRPGGKDSQQMKVSSETNNNINSKTKRPRPRTMTICFLTHSATFHGFATLLSLSLSRLISVY